MEDFLEAAALGAFSDDEDDFDDDVVLQILDGVNVGNRAELYGRFNLDEVANAEAKTLFRFEKEDISRLAAALEIPDNINVDNMTLSGKLIQYIIFLFCHTLPKRALLQIDLSS